MKYRVHRVEVNRENMQEKLQDFINQLTGEVVSIIPNVKPLIMMYGSKINYILIVEKLK